MKKVITLIILFLNLTALAIAQVGVGYDFTNPSNKVVIDIPEDQINYSLVNVNNSLYWNGHAWDEDKWLYIDGSNADQNIDISPYNLSVGYVSGDGSQLTNIGSGTHEHYDQVLNTTSNVTFSYVEVEYNLTAKNATFEYLNVTENLYVKNSTIYLGNVSISSIEYPDGSKTVTFGDSFVNASGYFGDGGFLNNISFVNGSVIATAFNGTAFYGGNFTGDNFTGTNAFFKKYNWLAEYPFLEFNGSLLRFNESALQDFVDGINDQNLNTTSGVEFANVTSDFYGTYDWTAEYPWLNFNGTYLYFNETELNNSYISNTGYNYLNGTLNVTNLFADNIDVLNLTAEQIYAIDIVAGTIDVTNMTVDDLSATTIFTRNFTINGTPDGFCMSDGTGCNTTQLTLANETIYNWSTFEVNEYEEVILINSSDGSINQSSNLLNFEITQIIVEPTTPGNKYRFEAIEADNGDMIDRNRKRHTGDWNIYKSHIINDNVNVSITDTQTDEVFTIRIKYLDNYR